MFSAMTSAIFAVGLDPQKLLESIGLIGLFIVIFAESGILIGFFLPGDSLLFTAGLATYGLVLREGEDKFQLASGHIWIVVLGVVIAAIAGDQVGYAFGNKVGPSLFKRPESRLFKPSYVESAEKFFAKHGSKSIVLARFVPIVRTFTPIVAGVSNMHYRTFVKFNVIGGILWGAGLTLLGYTLGRAFPAIGDNIEIAVLVIVFVSLLPVVIEFIRHRRTPKGKHFAE
ncbi:MAG: VTT domain-containing protein [Actinomycetes bacterium]